MPTYDDIDKMHDSIHDADQKFKLHFKTNARQFMDPLVTGLKKRFGLDVIKFDNWLRQQGYKEKKHGSAYEYIVLIYGESAARFVRCLLKRRVIKRRRKINDKN